MYRNRQKQGNSFTIMRIQITAKSQDHSYTIDVIKRRRDRNKIYTNDKKGMGYLID